MATSSDAAPWAPEPATDAGHSPAGEDTGRPAPVEDATIERPRPDRPLPAFPGVPAETWSTAAQPWEQADDGQPYDWYADPEPGAETPWGPPQPGSPSAPPSGPQQQATWAPPGAQQPPALGAPLPPGAPYPPAPGAGQAPMPGSPQPPAFGAQHAPLPGAPRPGGTQPGAPQPAAAWPQPEPSSPWAPDQPQVPWTPASGEAQTPWAPPHADQAPQTEWQPSPGPQAEPQPSPGPQAEWQPSTDSQAEWQSSPAPQAEWQPSPGPQAGPWTPSPGPQAEPWKPSPAAWQTEPDQADSTWQPPQAFTAAAAGMKVWPSHTTDAPAMPPWPAATGEPIDDHDGSQEAQADDPNATVSFAHGAEPGDVPVWPPLPPDADQADDRIPDLPFDSATWGRPKGDAPPADVLDDVPGDRAATPETADPTPSGSPTAGASGSGTPNAGASGMSAANAGAATPGASPTAAPGNDSSPNDLSGNSGSGSDMSGSAASGSDMSGNGASGNAMSGNGAPGDDMSGNGTTASDSPDDHPFPTNGAIPLPAIPPTAGLPALPAPPAGAPAAPPAVPGGSPAADLPTPPHGAPAATFDPFSPMSQGGIAPPAEPAVKEPSKGKKALIASLGVLVVAGVATGGFFAYRSMSTGQPAGPSASGAPSSVPSVSGTDDPLANSLLNSEGTDPEKMSINEAFPEQKVDIGGRVYTRVKVDMSDDCKLAAAGPFATALQDQKCSRVLRATYVDDKKRYAISTGIAVLPTKEAAAAADQAKDLDKNLWFRPLPGAASSGADRVHIAGGYAAGLLWGRYIVFSYATYADGHTPTAKEKGLGDVSGAFRDHTSLVLERRITE
ncbi:hypothetical protein AB0B45_42500 [Nonomuraea sp. NPDC049152]|uniref:hypothetical protein n=1 Tax=Nonomuraea sp. NPDC049152 TaxID=3154350 RepID=UPI003405BA0B